jgi:riboflavin kinase/FMN adenylyltransferase
VYAAYALLNGARYKAAVSIGEPPTFSPELHAFNPFFFEAHLLDFEGSLYEQELALEFVEKLRPMQRFDSQEELIATVQSNISWVRENL